MTTDMHIRRFWGHANWLDAQADATERAYRPPRLEIDLSTGLFCEPSPVIPNETLTHPCR